MGRPSVAALAGAVSVALALSSVCARASDLGGLGSRAEPAAQACDVGFDAIEQADPLVRSVLARLDASPTNCGNDGLVGVSREFPVADADGDGVPDGSDDCPIDADPEQLDRDRDAVGDACDNCAAVANPDQADGFGAAGIGDACDCPCFTAADGLALAAELADPSIYRAPACIDAGTGSKPLMALSATRLDGARCAVGSRDCSLLAVEFTEDRVCQWNPPVPARGVTVQGITDAQREACRRNILGAVVALAFRVESCRGILTSAAAEGIVCN